MVCLWLPRWKGACIMRLTPKSDIDVKKVFIRVKGRRVPLLILRPKNPVCPKKKAGVLWIHGGGYLTGMKEMVYAGRAENLVRRFGVTVIAPGYHLAFMKPYPAAIEDCYAALLFMKKHADEYGIRLDQLMVGGESAGGGLAAAVCIKARNRGDVNVAFQMPLYPMLDNFDTETSKDNHAKVWNTKTNHLAWKLYLRENYRQEVSPYAAPARLKDFRGLPPAYSFVGTAEPFYAETLSYFEHLKEAGVECELDIYPDMYHAFDMMEPKLPVSQTAGRIFEEKFAYAMRHYTCPQKK